MSEDRKAWEKKQRENRILDKASRDQRIHDLGRAFFDFSLDHPDYLKLIMVYEANTCVYDPGSLKNAARGTHKYLCQQETDAIADLITRPLLSPGGQTGGETDYRHAGQW